jgi:hypothetical protein
MCRYTSLLIRVAIVVFSKSPSLESVSDAMYYCSSPSTSEPTGHLSISGATQSPQAHESCKYNDETQYGQRGIYLHHEPRAIQPFGMAARRDIQQR